jgi:hypothetical protein
MILFWLVVVAWVLGIGVGAMMSLGEGQYTLGIFLAALAYAPIAIIKLRSQATLRKTEGRLHDLKRSLGDGEALARHVEKDTGIFVHSVRRKIGVVAGGASRLYEYGEVRSWATRAMPDDWRLVVGVRDTQNPMWYLHMRDPRERDRWMEILEQEINEARASA